MFSGSATMASSQSFSISQRRILLSPWPASPVNSEEPLWTSAMRLPAGVSWHILLAMFARKSIWPSLDRVMREYSLSSACVILKRGSLHAILPAHRFEVILPALAVGWIGEHELELSGGKGVVRERGVFGAADDILGVVALALQQHIGLADGVGFGVDLLAEEKGRRLLVPLSGEVRSVSSATVNMPPVPQAPS